MSQPRKIGVMIDNKEIERNLNQMSDSIRNANYKMLSANNIQPNEDGEYIDAEGENLLMSEEDVKALLRDAVDSYLVAALPGANKNSSQDFQHYLWDSFPNVAEQIHNNPAVTSYLSALFASTCGMLSSTLSPAIQDIAAANQAVGSIEVFNCGPENSYYILIGEEEVTDANPEHIVPKLSKEERQQQTKDGLLQELGPEGYAQYQRDQQAIKLAEGHRELDIAFGEYGEDLVKACRERLTRSSPQQLNGWVDNDGVQHVTALTPHQIGTRYYSSSVDDDTGKTEASLDLVIHPQQVSQKPVATHEPILFPDS